MRDASQTKQSAKESAKQSGIIAITQGDENGIGPEVIVKAFAKLSPALKARILVLGQDETMRLNKALTRPITSPQQFGKASQAENLITVLETKTPLTTAAHLALAGKIAAIVTAPASKGSPELDGTGQTEFFAKAFKVKEPVMMLLGAGLKVVPLTRHIPLNSVAANLDPQSIKDQILICAEALASGMLGAQKPQGKLANKPQLALCGINPHAGEGGLMGTEEQEILAPIIQELQQNPAFDIFGPLPADSAFSPHIRSKFDAIFCPTHDQALIPVKCLAGHDCVNITLGLPILRCSPGHGTANDIAGKGIARPDGMINAIKFASQTTSAPAKIQSKNLE